MKDASIVPEENNHSMWRRHAIFPYASLTLAIGLFVAASSLLPREAGYDLFGGYVRYEYYSVSVFLIVPIVLGVIAFRIDNFGANPAMGRFIAYCGILLALLQLCIPWFSTGFYCS